jgi:hypothetical protein
VAGAIDTLQKFVCVADQGLARERFLALLTLVEGFKATQPELYEEALGVAKVLCNTMKPDEPQAAPEPTPAGGMLQ